jgi:hypothetical protein
VVVCFIIQFPKHEKKANTWFQKFLKFVYFGEQNHPIKACHMFSLALLECTSKLSFILVWTSSSFMLLKAWTSSKLFWAQTIILGANNYFFFKIHFCNLNFF